MRGYSLFEVVNFPDIFERAKRHVYDGLERGDYQPVIDSTFPLEQVADAHRHMASNTQKGNVVVAWLTTCLISGVAFAANASAFAAIDWSTLEIEIIGAGALIPTEDPFASNHAYITDEHLHTLSSQQHVLLPAIAAHPFYGGLCIKICKDS